METKLDRLRGSYDFTDRFGRLWTITPDADPDWREAGLAAECYRLACEVEDLRATLVWFETPREQKPSPAASPTLLKLASDFDRRIGELESWRRGVETGARAVLGDLPKPEPEGAEEW